MEKLLYLEVNLVCIAILFTVFIRDAQQRNNDTYHILFKRVLFSNIFFFIADIVWGLLTLSHKSYIYANWATNIIYFSMSGIAAYFWIVFADYMIDSKAIRKKWVSVVYLLPPALLVMLSIVSINTHWLFYIDDAGHYQRGMLYVLQPILAYILPVFATIKAIHAYRKNQNIEKKKQCRSIAMFYILPAIGGVCQMLLSGTPMLNIGIALSGLFVYFTFQDNLIMLDPLTSMYNRRAFDRELDGLIRNFDSVNRLWLIIMDVDYFKKINDGFGHAEGDRALITIAKVLKEVCGEYNCYAARIGGDEFAVCCESDDGEYPRILCDDIEERLRVKSGKYPFKLKMSMGYSEYNPDITAQQLYVFADKKLYEAKASR